jgi:hypothetical protein
MGSGSEISTGGNFIFGGVSLGTSVLLTNRTGGSISIMSTIDIGGKGLILVSDVLHSKATKVELVATTNPIKKN